MPRITKPTQIRVHGWIMLAKVDSGDYRIEPSGKQNGRATYAFFLPRGRKQIIRHYAESVDAWIRPSSHDDLNRIEILDN